MVAQGRAAVMPAIIAQALCAIIGGLAGGAGHNPVAYSVTE
jgi:hypothetical protein